MTRQSSTPVHERRREARAYAALGPINRRERRVRLELHDLREDLAQVAGLAQAGHAQEREDADRLLAEIDRKEAERKVIDAEGVRQRTACLATIRNTTRPPAPRRMPTPVLRHARARGAGRPAARPTSSSSSSAGGGGGSGGEDPEPGDSTSRTSGRDGGAR